MPFLAGWVFLFGLFIGGWWLSFVALAAWWLLLLAGFVYGAYSLVRLLPVMRSVHPIWAVLVGLGVIWVVGAIPFVGWLAVLAATVLGTGALAKTIWERRVPREPGAPMPATVPQPYGYEMYPAYPGGPEYPVQPPTYPQPPTYAPPEYPPQPPTYAPPGSPHAEWRSYEAQPGGPYAPAGGEPPPSVTGEPFESLGPEPAPSSEGPGPAASAATEAEQPTSSETGGEAEASTEDAPGT